MALSFSILRHNRVCYHSTAARPAGIRRTLKVSSVAFTNKSSNQSDSNGTARASAPNEPYRPLSINYKWPSNFKKRLEAVTIERVYEADVTPPVFDFELWRRHRNRWRFLEHMFTLLGSHFLKDLAPPVLSFMAVAAAVCCYEGMLEAGYLHGFPNLALAAPEPFKDSCFALSLMLVFRTNSSYARWAEARCLWGSLVNRSRNLVRQVLLMVPDSTIKWALVRWSIAFPRTVKAHLREDGDVQQELAAVLQPHELAYVSSAAHQPLAALQAMTHLLVAAQLDVMRFNHLDENLVAQEDILGACERILKTPIPLSYTRHMARFLTLWLTALPVAMYEDIHAYVIPVAGALSFLLLGINQIAIHLEEPFALLSLEAICDTITQNLEELAGADQQAQISLNQTLYPMHQAQVQQQQQQEQDSVDALEGWQEIESQLPGRCWHNHSLEDNDFGHAWVRERSIDDLA